MPVNLKGTLCRLCFSEEVELLGIFESKGIPGWTAAIAITELLQIQVSEGVTHPKYVCIDCMRKLEEFKKFKLQCERNNALLDRACVGNRTFGSKEEDSLEKYVGGSENRSEFYLKEEDVEVVIEKDPNDLDEGMNPIKTEIEDCSNDSNEIYSTEVIGSSDEVSFTIKNQYEERIRTLENDQQNTIPHSSAGRTTKLKEETCDMNDPGENKYEKSDNCTTKEEVLSLSGESDSNDGIPGISGGLCGSSSVYNRLCVSKGNDGSSHSGISELYSHSSVPHADDKAGRIGVANLSSMECINTDGEQVGEPSSISSNAEVNTNSCDICGKRLAPTEDMEAHLSGHCGEKPFKCELCGRGFHLNRSLEKHECNVGEDCGVKSIQEPLASDSCDKDVSRTGGHTLVNVVKKPFQCTECGRTFSNKNGLKVHLMSHFADGPYKCTVCSKAFSRKHHLNVHVLIHSGNRPFQCSQCSKAFFQKVHLSKHMATHSRNTSFDCNHCGQTFSERDQYRKHLTTHSEEKVFKCMECSKEFSAKVHFQRHMLTHTGDRPFKCTQCSMTFCQKVHLKTHLMTHSGVRPFECTMCGKAFTRKAHLQTHVMTHSGARPFKCDKCSKAFTQKTHLNTHMVTHS